jgi:uncharacterized protein (TIGR03437 family)
LAGAAGNIDPGTGIAVDSLGQATVVGSTKELDFPLLNAIQPQAGGCPHPKPDPCPFFDVQYSNLPEDAFIARLNAQGSALVYSTYFGGNGLEGATAVALDPAGNAYVTGEWGSGIGQFTPAGLVQASTGSGVFVLKIASAGSSPQFTSSSVVNGASFLQGDPGSGGIATLFGTGLSKVSGIVQAGAMPLPTQIEGTSVLYGGVLAPLFAVVNVTGEEQINFQVPLSANVVGGSAIIVNNNGSMNAAMALPSTYQPGIFTTDGSNGAILHANYQRVTEANPAVGGEVLLLYATGLGLCLPIPATAIRPRHRHSRTSPLLT